jgi:hypothetical protein
MSRMENSLKNTVRFNTSRRRSIVLCALPTGILAWLIASLALMSLLAFPVQADSWKGEEVEKEGVLHVVNPDQPMEAAKTVKLKKMWRIGGDTDDEDQFFGLILQITTDDKGNVYLLDTQLAQVKIFSQNGEFVRDIGREGEGPGEFRFPLGMFFTKDGNLAVMQVAPGKIVLLSPEGEPMGEYPIPKSDDGGFLLLLGGYSRAGNVVLAMRKDDYSQEKRFATIMYLAGINAQGEETARYFEETRVVDFADPVLDEMKWDTFDRRWTVGWDGRVYAATEYQGYNIHVWNKNGSLDRIIEVAKEPRKRTQEQMDIAQSIYEPFKRRIPNAKLSLAEHIKDVETFYSREDGSLWVLSGDGMNDNPDGSIGIFDVFDAKGHFVRRVTLVGEGDPLTDGYYFVGDRLYVVTDLLQAYISLQSGGQSFQIGEEEPEPMAVICYELDKDLRITQR